MKKKVRIKMNKRIIIYLLASILLALLNLYTTKDFIFSGVLLIISIIFFFLLIEKEYVKYKRIDKTTHECIAFINQFIITLSINHSIQTTFESIKDSLKDELKIRVENMEDKSVEDALSALREYFNLNVYDFFVKIIKQYIDNGGDILKLTQLLIFDSRKLQTSLDDFKIISKRKAIEFMSLWGLTFLILIIIQLSLSMFYDSILKMEFYSPSIFGFFLVFLLFLYLFMKHIFNLSFINDWREVSYEEDKESNWRIKS